MPLKQPLADILPTQPILPHIALRHRGGTQKHRRDTKTQEGHKDTGGTQKHRRDTKTQEETKTQEGDITHRHFRRIKGELTDQKDFIRGDH